MSFLDNLQNKPRPARVKILWTTTGIVALLLFFSWLVIPKKYPHDESKVGMLSSLKGELQEGLTGEEYQNIQKGWGEFSAFQDESEKVPEDLYGTEEEGEKTNESKDYRLPLEE